MSPASYKSYMSYMSYPFTALRALYCPVLVYAHTAPYGHTAHTPPLAPASSPLQLRCELHLSILNHST